MTRWTRKGLTCWETPSPGDVVELAPWCKDKTAVYVRFEGKIGDPFLDVSFPHVVRVSDGSLHYLHHSEVVDVLVALPEAEGVPHG